MMDAATADNKQLHCPVCSKIICTKQRLLTHIDKKHPDVPISTAPYAPKKYKQYLTDPNTSMPRTTIWRRNRETYWASGNNIDRTELVTQCETTGSNLPSSSYQSEACNDALQEQNESTLADSSFKSLTTEYGCDHHGSHANNAAQTTDEDISIDANTNSCFNGDGLSGIASSSKDKYASAEEVTLFSVENDFDLQIPVDKLAEKSMSESSIFSDSEEATSSDECISSNSELDSDNEQFYQGNSEPMTLTDSFSMAVLSLISKYHLNGECASDMLFLMSLLNKSKEEIDIGSLNSLKQTVGSCDAKLYHYCYKCFTIFPEDETVYICSKEGCGGLKYKGNETQQMLKQKKMFFASLPLETQIKDILEREGVLKTIKKYRSESLGTGSAPLTDITSGEVIHDLRKPGNLLSDSSNISLLFNTDGVPLYKSSAVSIWPIYLVINELPPSERFSIKNMIVWGIWQGQGKPVFSTYLEPFIKDLQCMYDNGLTITVDSEEMRVKAVLISGTLDLQAKAYVTNMTQHNGEYGCITCEEPGQVTKQGKGHCRVYPYRDNPAILRTSNAFMMCAREAERTSATVKGVKGTSPLLQLQHFDIITGIVPDYMHGVLLGVVKKMLNLLLKSCNSKEPYYIGKHIKEVDKMLKSMCPTDQLSRLPRKLESNIGHLKASELLSWLLFYSMPCLKPFMTQQYYDHWALLVEGIYIMLGDQISEQNLLKAESCLKEFHSKFADLYGKNNCTLNLHNTCVHLPYYARKLGPLWAWSCFPFEDMNGTVLQSVHGTGDVCMQMLWTVQAQKRLSADVNLISEPSLRSFTERMASTGRRVKTKQEALNCKFAGALKTCDLTDEIKAGIRMALNIPDGGEIGEVSKGLRIVKGNTVFFSKDYGRVTKRISYYVLVKDVVHADVVSVLYFIYHHASKLCFAVANKVAVHTSAFVHNSVSHILRISNVVYDGVIVFNVDNILEKVIFLNGNEACICISRLPSLYGQLS